MSNLEDLIFENKIVRLPKGLRLFAKWSNAIIEIPTHYRRWCSHSLQLCLPIYPISHDCVFVVKNGRSYPLEARSRETLRKELRTRFFPRGWLMRNKKKSKTKVKNKKRNIEGQLSLIEDIRVALEQEKLRNHIHKIYLSSLQHKAKSKIKQKVLYRI